MTPRLLFAATVSALSMNAAQAQDFGGAYLTFGLAVGETDFNSTSALVGPTVDRTNGPAAVYIGTGYDFVFDSFVVGAMADYETAMSDVSVTAGKDSYELEGDWFATARLRGGYLVRDDTLVYASAGVARLSTRYQTTAFLAPSEDGVSVENGAVFGLGFEHQLNEAASLRLEFLHADFGNSGPLGDVPFEPRIEPNHQTARFGIVIRF